MKKPFFRYEDVPLILARGDERAAAIFANSASISVDQSLSVKKTVDDYNISFALQTGDLYFPGVQESGLLMGPVDGPAIKAQESIEVIKSGSRISYPNGASLYLTEDLLPGDYYVNVRSTGETLLRKDEDIPYGEVEVLRNYAANDIARGTLNISYYMNTGNLESFSDVTGLMDLQSYPHTDEGKITGSLGDYMFYDAYIKEVSFSAQPFQPIQTNVTLDIYGALDVKEGLSEEIIENYGCYGYILPPQKNIPHAMNTKIVGSESAGMKYPLSFSYKITAERKPEVYLPISGGYDDGGEIPDRVTKEDIEVVIELAGERLDPHLKLDGQRADVSIKLSDLGFDPEYTDNNVGSMKEFRLLRNPNDRQPYATPYQAYGVIESNKLTISDQGYLQGSVTIRQSYR